MTLQNGSQGEQELRRVIEDWSDALRNKDIERLWSHYAPGIVAFDLAPPLRHGPELRDELAAWFATWAGPIGYELHDLRITVGSNVAFSHGLSRLRGRRTDGETTDVWTRTTVCFQRDGTGRWKIVHEHASVPFYMDGSFRAAVDLQPSGGA